MQHDAPATIAMRRLADEYDAAQDRGEVAGHGGARNSNLPDEKVEPLSTAAVIGLSHKDIHDAWQVRDAEQASPGIVRRSLDTLVAAKVEPTRAAVARLIDADDAVAVMATWNRRVPPRHEIRPRDYHVLIFRLSGSSH